MEFAGARTLCWFGRHHQPLQMTEHMDSCSHPQRRPLWCQPREWHVGEWRPVKLDVQPGGDRCGALRAFHVWLGDCVTSDDALVLFAYEDGRTQDMFQRSAADGENVMERPPPRRLLRARLNALRQWEATQHASAGRRLPAWAAALDDQSADAPMRIALSRLRAEWRDESWVQIALRRTRWAEAQGGEWCSAGPVDYRGAPRDVVPECAREW